MHECFVMMGIVSGNFKLPSGDLRDGGDAGEKTTQVSIPKNVSSSGNYY